MAGGVSASRAANLEASGEMLSTFQKRVTALLAEFEGSAGSTTKVGSQRIARTSLHSGSSCFAEAEDLYDQYERVHERLTSLTKTLGLQIEAIGIAVKGAKIGFSNLEEDLRHRFWEIQTELQQEQDSAQREKAGKPDDKLSDSTGSGTGYR
ncbi:hypothetical protein C4B68_10740 [Streptomyces dengpaensis]|uniref:Uncharacterized protein n=2 Tax=Streptomyces TaxID=1883 RepID=A0ABM6SNF9_9ACTN|nr:hypothetical protein C4B68_10740 [Streptomyces dengpaensis]PIB07129.1 hypothetical protein B1C81_20615 [Streptomyces sp. HG99]